MRKPKTKDTTITFRVAQEIKHDWQEYCKVKEITLTDMLTVAAYHYVKELRPLKENGKG